MWEARGGRKECLKEVTKARIAAVKEEGSGTGRNKGSKEAEGRYEKDEKEKVEEK